MLLSVCDVLYECSHNSHQHVSVGIPAGWPRDRHSIKVKIVISVKIMYLIKYRLKVDSY